MFLRLLQDGGHTDEIGAIIVVILQPQYRVRDVEYRDQSAFNHVVVIHIVFIHHLQRPYEVCRAMICPVGQGFFSCRKDIA